MKKEDKFDYIIPFATFPYVFWLFYLFENGFDWISIILGFVLICVSVAAYIVVRG